MQNRTKDGFTLIELMVSICIIGVLASVAVPTFQRFMDQARGSEAVTDLSSLYRGAVAYYERPAAGQGITASGAGHCLLWREDNEPPCGIVPSFPPLPTKRTANFATDSFFSALGFSKADPSYFTLIVVSALDEGGTMRAKCGGADGLAYAFFAASDINGDGLVGGMSLLAHVRNGQLVRAAGFGNVGAYFEYMGVACPFCAPGIN